MAASARTHLVWGEHYRFPLAGTHAREREFLGIAIDVSVQMTSGAAPGRQPLTGDALRGLSKRIEHMPRPSAPASHANYTTNSGSC